MPAGARPEQPYAQWTHLGPRAIREKLGDGNFAGRYQRADDEMFTLWRAAVEETRALIAGGWE
jgi:creatinine amidohydrolase